MKVPLLLFSGGLDSTYMLHSYLLKGDVETLYIQAGQCTKKIEQELIARRAIIDKLERITGNRVREDHRFDIGREIFNHVPDCTWHQPAQWIIGALQVTDAAKHDHLAIGYVSGDCVLSRIESMRQAWTSLQAFTKGTPIPVEFPIHLYVKHDIVNAIDPRVYPDLWTCEMPVLKDGKYVACDCCVPCHDKASYMFEWRRRNGVSHAKHLRDEAKRLGPIPKRPPPTLEEPTCEGPLVKAIP